MPELYMSLSEAENMRQTRNRVEANSRASPQEALAMQEGFPVATMPATQPKHRKQTGIVATTRHWTHASVSSTNAMPGLLRSLTSSCQHTQPVQRKKRLPQQKRQHPNLSSTTLTPKAGKQKRHTLGTPKSGKQKRQHTSQQNISGNLGMVLEPEG